MALINPFPYLYEPQAMIAGIRQVPPIRTFLKDTFFGNNVFHTTADVKLDVFKGARRIAQYVNPINEALTVERQGYTTFSTRPAYIKEKTAITVDDTRTRAFGENPYAASTPEQRAAQLLMADMAMLNDRITRREELMCAQALVDGKLSITGNGWDANIDFGYVPGVHTQLLTGAAGWNQTGSNPIKDLDDWRLAIQQRCGITPTHCILGRDAAWALAGNAQVKAMLTNTINQQWGLIAPQDQGNGVSTYGILTLPSGRVTFTSYNEWYRDPATGDDVPLIPPDVCILASTDARAEFHYGLIQNLYSLQAVPRFPYSWISDDGKARFVQLESAPMPNLLQTDAFMVSRVLS